MTKQEIQNLVEEYIKRGVEETTNGSYIWCCGEVEDYLQSNLSETEMQMIEDELTQIYSDVIAEARVYTSNDDKVVIDCVFWLDACEQTCRNAVLFHNTKDDEKYYLQHKDLPGTEQGEETDKDLLNQADKLQTLDFNTSCLDEEFEIENVSNATGIRNIIKTIQFQ